MRLARHAAIFAWSVLAIAISFVPASAEKRVALVIGNGNYESTSKLSNPANDAADIAAALRALGFDVLDGYDLGKRAMEDKVRNFSRKLDDATLALFFYAGHGLQVAGRNYLLPVDAKLERSGDLNLEALDVSLVLQQMETDKRVNLVFLDACRDNPLSRSFARTLGSRSTTVVEGLAPIKSAVGTMIAYATEPNNVALDGAGRNSPFTTALLKYIATPGLEISSLMKRVRADVVVATREKQVPWDHSSLLTDVVLVPNASVPAAPGPGSAQREPSQLDPAERAWSIIHSTTSLAVLEDFIRQFGTSPYGSMARARLEELKRERDATASASAAAAAAASAAEAERRRASEQATRRAQEELANLYPPAQSESAARLLGNWSLVWQGAADNYTGTLLVISDKGGNIYYGKVTLIRSNGDVITQEANITVNGNNISIACFNPSQKTWNPDRFFVTRAGDQMKGYSLDAAGARGKSITFTRHQ